MDCYWLHGFSGGMAIKGVMQTQLTFRFREKDENGKQARTTTFIPYEWRSRNQSKIITAIADLKRKMDDPKRSVATLKDVEKIKIGPVGESNNPVVANWDHLINDFLKSRSSKRDTTQKDLETNIRRLLEILISKPRPQNDTGVVENNSEKFFAFPSI